MNLHGQVQFLGKRDVRAESFPLKFFGGFAGTEEIHAGFAYGHNLIGVGVTMVFAHASSLRSMAVLLDRRLWRATSRRLLSQRSSSAKQSTSCAGMVPRM